LCMNVGSKGGLRFCCGADIRRRHEGSRNLTGSGKAWELLWVLVWWGGSAILYGPDSRWCWPCWKPNCATSYCTSKAETSLCLSRSLLVLGRDDDEGRPALSGVRPYLGSGPIGTRHAKASTVWSCQGCHLGFPSTTPLRECPE
jgi:hypothetical protein